MKWSKSLKQNFMILFHVDTAASVSPAVTGLLQTASSDSSGTHLVPQNNSK